MIEIRYCTAKYGFEDTGRTAFADTGPARLAWNKLVVRAWDEKQPQWIAIYIPGASNSYRRERGREPVEERYIKKIGVVQEIPPPPKPHFWKNFGLDRWPLGVPTGRKLILRTPVDVNDYIDAHAIGSFRATMEQSSLYPIEGTDLAICIQNMVERGNCRPAPRVDW
jgi:hypothetical protein